MWRQRGQLQPVLSQHLRHSPAHPQTPNRDSKRDGDEETHQYRDNVRHQDSDTLAQIGGEEGRGREKRGEEGRGGGSETASYRHGYAHTWRARRTRLVSLLAHSYRHVLYYVYVLHMHISYTCVHLVSEGGDIRISSRLYIYVFIHIYTYIYNHIYIYIYIRRFLHGYTCLDIISIHNMFQK